MATKRNLSTFSQIFFSKLPSSLQLFVKDNTDVVKRMDYDKQDIFLYIDSPVESEFRLKSCFHEPETVKWIEKFLKKDETIFDVGANIGAYSLIMAKVHKGKNKVYAFEPNFTSYNKLCKNIILNNCDESIFPFQLALSEKYGIDTLNYSSFEVGSAYHTIGDNRFLKSSPKYRQPIITYSIDKFISDFKLSIPQHIKIDVDGLEYDILRGAIKTLSSKSFRTLNVEIDENSKNSQKIITFVKSLGFTFYQKYTDINAGDPDTDEFKIYNYIFTK